MAFFIREFKEFREIKEFKDDVTLNSLNSLNSLKSLLLCAAFAFPFFVFPSDFVKFSFFHYLCATKDGATAHQIRLALVVQRIERRFPKP